MTDASTEQKYLDACLSGDVDEVTNMIKKENKKFKSNYFLLKCLNNACEGGHIHLVEILLGLITSKNSYSQIDINKANTLYHAFKGGNVDIINIIASKAPNDWCYSLHGACETNRIDLFKLYAHKAYLWRSESTRKHYLNECLIYACACNSDNYETINYLVQEGATNLNGGLFHACKYKSISVVKYILELSSEYKYKCTDWVSYFISTCEGGCFEVAEFMFNKCINIHPNTHVYFLHAAAKGGCKEIINLLTTKGWDEWECGLEGACVGGHPEIAKIMITNGATNLNHCLYVACLNGHANVAKVIITSGVTYISSCCLCACLDSNFGIKGKFCDLELIKMMTDKKENVDWVVCLKYACKGGNVQIVKFMLDKVSDISTINMIFIDISTDNTDVINLFISKGATDFSSLHSTTNFRLYCVYLSYYTSLRPEESTECMEYLQEYPPYILFVASRLTKADRLNNCGSNGSNKIVKTNKICHIDRLPVELFRLLFKY